MKVHLAKVSLALLSTVFLLGCQEQGSGPMGPEGTGIQAKPGMGGMGGGGGGGGETEAATYTVTHAGDITTAPPTVTAIPHPGKPGKAIQMGAAVGNGDRIVLSDDFVMGVPYPERREACFQKTNGTRVFDLVGILIRVRKNKIEGQYVFSAFGPDGTTPVNYNLAMTGTATGPFAPDPGQTTTVTWDDVSLGAQSESEVSACAPGGSDRISVEITDLQLEVEVEGDPAT